MLPHGFIVIARNIHHPGTSLGHSQNRVDDFPVHGGPVNAYFQAPEVDYVTYQIQIVTLYGLQELQKMLGFTAFVSQVNIGDPD